VAIRSANARRKRSFRVREFKAVVNL
jgi:hypothetical protein